MNNEQKIFRNEQKFILNKYDAELIRSSVACSCYLDEHTNANGSYDIKSIYFDTILDKCMYETINGENFRHKFRARRYGDSNSLIKFEKKIAENGLKRKEYDNIQQDILLELLDDIYSVRDTSKYPVLAEFIAEHMLYTYRPVVVVGYNRIPYVYPMGNVRVTFDRNIVASDDIGSFWGENTGTEKEVLKDGVVLEVKYDDFLPKFIRDILNESGIMSQTSFSKYVMARAALKGTQI